jgi:hypothetical protein
LSAATLVATLLGVLRAGGRLESDQSKDSRRAQQGRAKQEIILIKHDALLLRIL